MQENTGLAGSDFESTKTEISDMLHERKAKRYRGTSRRARRHYPQSRRICV